MIRKNVLVTGAGGFIGRHLCRDLAQDGHFVIGIDLQYPPAESAGRLSNFRAVTADFRDRIVMQPLLEGIEVVFHLASAHLEINLSEVKYRSVNVTSLRPLLELAHKSGAKRFVHVSSAGVYGNLKSWPADEDTPCNPQNTYGQSKLDGENKVKKYFAQTSFPVVILRPAWVYGSGCQRTFKIYKTLAKRRFVMIGSGSNFRHPVFIADMLAAFRLAMASTSAVGETILIGGDQSLTTKELLKSFCSVLDLPEPKINLPMKLGEFMAAGCETVFKFIGKEPPISRRSLEFFNTTNAFDISKAKRLLGFQPSFSLTEGLRESQTWLENQYAGNLKGWEA